MCSPGFLACSDRSSWALLSVLGVPGWGPLHLLLKQRSDPAQIAQRLRHSLAHAGLPISGCHVPGGRLLAALLRSQADLDPVAPLGAGAALSALRFRHRLVCRDAHLLIIHSWERQGSCRRWHSLGPGQRLEEFLQSRP